MFLAPCKIIPSADAEGFGTINVKRQENRRYEIRTGYPRKPIHNTAKTPIIPAEPTPRITPQGGGSPSTLKVNHTDGCLGSIGRRSEGSGSGRRYWHSIRTMVCICRVDREIPRSQSLLGISFCTGHGKCFLLRCVGVQGNRRIVTFSIGLKYVGAIASLREERCELSTGLGNIVYNSLIYVGCLPRGATT